MSSSRFHQRRLKVARAFARRLKSELGPSLSHIVLYGSVARGDDQQESDIDLLVEVRRRSRALEARVYDAVTEIAADEGELVVPIVLTAAEVRKRLPASLRARIRDEGQILV